MHLLSEKSHRIYIKNDFAFILNRYPLYILNDLKKKGLKEKKIFLKSSFNIFYVDPT